MDENKYLVLLKGEDKTNGVLSVKKNGGYLEIYFNDKNDKYNYNIKHTYYAENPEVIDITNKVVYSNNFPIYDVKQVLDFGEKMKIILNKGGESKVYDSKLVRIESNCINSNVAEDILSYWKDISQYTGEDEETFLKKEYDKLKFVSPQSVLGSYINKEQLKISLKDMNNIFPFRFNLKQKEALENALNCNISIIEGPPGTGKTQTILNIIANLSIIQGKTVAVVSGNNAAIENINDKLKKQGYDFFVATLGKKEKKENFFKNLPQCNISDWRSDIEISKLLEKINVLNNKINDMLELNNKKARIQQELAAYHLEQQHFEYYFNNQNIEEIRKLSFYRKTPEKIISFLVDNYFAKKKEKTGSMIYKIKLFFKYGFTDFKKLRQKQMDIILNLQREYYDLKIKFLENQKESLKNQLEQESFDQLLKQHEEYSVILFRHKLWEKYSNQDVRSLDIKNYKRNFQKFMDNFPVILSTTHSLRNCIAENYLFDYIIIDESSQVDLLSGALALSCGKNAVIVGDTKQLPQIVDETIQNKIKEKHIEDTYNYFKHNILSSILSSYKGLVPKVLLQEHYRCHPRIIEFCNQKYYRGELIPFTEEKENDMPLILYHTSKGNHMREVTNGEKKGKFNQRELDVIKEEVLKNIKLCTDVKSDIGFTTPYRKQVEKANDQLDAEIECDTIHKYQGREKLVMIMSTVLDKTRSGRIGTLFVDDPCKINVAVSRAQNQFILVTDNSLFSKYGKEVSDLIRYIEYSTLDKNIIDSEIISVFDLLYKEYSTKLISMKNKLEENLRYKSENIIWTLLEKIIAEDEYKGLAFTTQVMLKNLLKNLDKLDDIELKYVNHSASVDFVIYRKLDKRPVLIVEIDGFAFHENNPKQLERDKIKDRILNKYDFEFIRLPTTDSGEEEKIKNKLDKVLGNFS